MIQHSSSVESKDILTGREKSLEINGMGKAVIIDNQTVHSAGRPLRNAYWREGNTGTRHMAHSKKPSVFEGPSTPEEMESARRGKKKIFDSFIKMQISGNPII